MATIVSQDASDVIEPSAHHKLANWVRKFPQRFFKENFKTKIMVGDLLGQNIGTVGKPEKHFFVGLLFPWGGGDSFYEFVFQNI